jgi:inner membrane protein
LDNVCHSLVGAACVRAGIAAPARLAMASSVIAANLPDLDVLVFASDVPSVAFRRGWTHGVLAQAVLPAALAGIMFAIAKRRVAKDDAPPAAFAPLLVLSYVGVLVHVFLDYLNNYGVRLLMPFSGRWFYGDSLFIIDPWLWVVLAVAVFTGSRGRLRATRTWLVAAAIYIAIMMVSARMAKSLVAEAWQRETAAGVQELMVGPVPVNPLRKAVIIDAGDRYYTGTFDWWGRRTSLFETTILKNDSHPAIAGAKQDRQVAGILVWSRFPFWEIDAASDGTRVTVRDVRFTRFGQTGFGTATVVK